MKHDTKDTPITLKKGMSALYFALLLSFGLIAISCNSGTVQNDKAESGTTSEAAQVPAAKYENIDVAQFDKLRDDTAYVVLDVRTPDEIDAGKVGEAMELDYYEPSFGGDLAKLDKDKSYLVYCKSGGRSAKTAQQMIDLGFARVYNLTGGYTSWYAAHPDNK